MNNFAFTLLARLIVIMTSIPVHEAAHAYAAKKMGDHTADARGRISLNPFDHIDLVGAAMILFAGFGWAKPVTVNPFLFRDRRKGMIVTAAAGPAANIVLAFICMILSKILSPLLWTILPGSSIAYAVMSVLSIMISSNISLAVFNLIPIPPLDGFKIFSEFLPSDLRRTLIENQRILSYLLIFVIFTNVLNAPMSFVVGIIYSVLDLATIFVDIGMGLIL